LDDSNVLENAESFQINLSAMDPVVVIQSTYDNIVLNINEDPLDGLFNYLVVANSI
jgi:hypothetical protein